MRAVVFMLVTAAALLLSACAQPVVPADVFYRLQVPAPAVQAARAAKGALEVARPRAEGVVAERPLVYAEAAMPNRLFQYAYHHWSEPPARMLQDELVGYLRAVGLSSLVTVPEQRARAVWHLSMQVRGLEQVRGEDGHVHLRLEFTLRRAADGELLWTRETQRREPTGDASVAAAVSAFERALADSFALLAGELIERL